MTLLGELVKEINARQPQLDVIQSLLINLGDSLPEPLEDKNIDENVMVHPFMMILCLACEHYQVDIYNSARQEVILAILNYLKQQESHLYLIALFYCYKAFFQLSIKFPFFEKCVEIVSLFKHKIYRDRLSDAHVEKCIHRASFHFVTAQGWSLTYGDVTELMDAAKKELALGAFESVKALKIEADGSRSPYSIYALHEYFFGVLEPIKIERLMRLVPLLKAELGSENLMKLKDGHGHFIDELFDFLTSSVIKDGVFEHAFSGVGYSTSQEVEQVEFFRRYYSILMDFGFVVDLGSPKMRKVLVDTFGLCFAKMAGIADPSVFFVAMTSVFGANPLSKIYIRHDGKMGNLFEYYELAFGYGDLSNAVILAKLIQEHLVFEKSNVDEVYRYLEELVGFAEASEKSKGRPVALPRNIRGGVKSHVLSIIISAVAANETVRVLGASLRFALLVVKISQVNKSLCRVMLDPALEQDKLEIESAFAGRYADIPSFLSVMTETQCQELSSDLNNAGDSRLAYLIHLGLQSDDYDHGLALRKLTLSSRVILSLPQAVKVRTKIQHYALALAKSGLPLVDVMSEISTLCERDANYLPAIKNDVVTMWEFLIAYYSPFTYFDVFKALPDDLKDALPVEVVIKRCTLHFDIKADLSRRYRHDVIAELQFHLTEKHKNELRGLFFEVFASKFKYDFIDGYSPNSINRDDQSRPFQGRNFLEFSEYQQLGIGLGARYEGRTLLQHPKKQETYQNTLILFQHPALQKEHAHFDGAYDKDNPVLLSRVLACSLVGLDKIDHEFYIHNQLGCMPYTHHELGLMSYTDAFVHWMIMKEYDNKISCLEVYPFGLPVSWFHMARKLKNRLSRRYITPGLLEREGSEVSRPEINAEAVMGYAVGVVMHAVGEESMNAGLTRQHARQTYVALLKKREVLLSALRDHLFLNNKPCLLLNILRTSDKDFELIDTIEFLEVFQLIKAGALSENAMLEFERRMEHYEASGQRSPREAVLYLALNQQLSDQEFDRIARHHLYVDFPLGDENHEAVKSALRLLNQTAIDSLQTRLALFAVDRDVGVKFKVKHGMENSKSERDLQNNLLMHVIMAGKRSLDPKPTKDQYKKMKKCVSKNYAHSGILTLFKQALPPGEAALGPELQKGDSLIAPLLDQRRIEGAQRRYSATLNGFL